MNLISYKLFEGIINRYLNVTNIIMEYKMYINHHAAYMIRLKNGQLLWRQFRDELIQEEKIQSLQEAIDL